MGGAGRVKLWGSERSSRWRRGSRRDRGDAGGSEFLSAGLHGPGSTAAREPRTVGAAPGGSPRESRRGHCSPPRPKFGSCFLQTVGGGYVNDAARTWGSCERRTCLKARARSCRRPGSSRGGECGPRAQPRSPAPFFPGAPREAAPPSSLPPALFPGPEPEGGRGSSSHRRPAAGGMEAGAPRGARCLPPAPRSAPGWGEGCSS